MHHTGAAVMLWTNVRLQWLVLNMSYSIFVCRGVAIFEQHCADHDIPVTFDAITQLYSDPNDLSPLPNDKTKLLVGVSEVLTVTICTYVSGRHGSLHLKCTQLQRTIDKWQHLQYFSNR